MNTQANKIYDELLVIRCQAGEHHAFSILVERWQGPMLKFASIVCRDNEIAKEAVQDTWLAVIRRIKSLRDPNSYQFWMLRILHRKCIDLLRHKNQKVASVPLSYEADSLEDELSSKPFNHLENQDQIIVILRSLSDKHRAVLALHYLHDLPLRDIAELLDIKEGTIKSRIFHAKSAFKRHYEQLERPLERTTEESLDE